MNAFFSSNSIPLIALHGWGMNESVWQSMGALLPDEIDFLALNLPGYGGTPALTEMTMDATVDWLADQFDGTCHLLGWSMGGLVAQSFCHRYPSRVESVSFVASTPSFVQRDGWREGMEEAVLKQFMQSLSENQSTTIRRFIALQFMGESGTAKLQKQLRESLSIQPPSSDTLDTGLKWLLNCDYRQDLERLPPQHWIFGGLDRLIPVSAGRDIQLLVPDASISYLDECGHAPLLTQAEAMTEKLLDFILQLKSK